MTVDKKLKWLARETPVHIAVIGDVMLDEYLEGSVDRISPEAPVPVHLVRGTSFGAGGAANAARNIKLAGGDVSLFSVFGDDEAGRRLKGILEKEAIDTSAVEVCTDRPTVRKMRITSGSHQMVRIDWEKVDPIGEALQNKLVDSLKSRDFDAILISDYGKGTLPIRLLSTVLEYAVQKSIPVVVDPKGRDFSKYLHATLITPNRKEACDALNLDISADWSGEELARNLQKTFGLQNVLVTMGAKGMVLVPANPGAKNGAIQLPAVAREVYDVSGAGDTVVALMTLSLGAKMDMADAMLVANTAAAIVVEKWGTQPIQLAELKAALQERPRQGAEASGSFKKVTTLDQLKHQIKPTGERSRRVVFTNGCFDILHAGHVSYLEEARSLGDMLVVGVNSDESVTRLKGEPRPFIKLENRMRVLAGLGCVDFVIPFSEDTPLDLIRELVPDILVKGADWEKDTIVGADIVKGAGGTVDTIKYLSGLSTTEIVNRIKLS